MGVQGLDQYLGNRKRHVVKRAFHHKGIRTYFKIETVPIISFRVSVPFMS